MLEEVFRSGVRFCSVIEKMLATTETSANRRPLTDRDRERMNNLRELLSSIHFLLKDCPNIRMLRVVARAKSLEADYVITTILETLQRLGLDLDPAAVPAKPVLDEIDRYIMTLVKWGRGDITTAEIESLETFLKALIATKDRVPLVFAAAAASAASAASAAAAG